MRHNKNCDWVVEPGIAYCPRCLQPVIVDEMVPDVPDAPIVADAPPAASASVSCPACGRDVVPRADGTCPWDGEPLATSAADDRPSVLAPGGYRCYLGDVPLTLGRLSEDPRLGGAVDADGVSRRHASIRVDGDGVVWLKDLGSTNGTWLGSSRVAVESRLPPGDSLVGLGREVTVTVHVP